MVNRQQQRLFTFSQRGVVCTRAREARVLRASRKTGARAHVTSFVGGRGGRLDRGGVCSCRRGEVSGRDRPLSTAIVRTVKLALRGRNAETNSNHDKLCKDWLMQLI